MYSLPYNAAQLDEMLRTLYCTEVRKRGATPVGKPETLRMISSAAAWLANPYRKPFLMLMGPVGNGKSTLARAIESLYVMQLKCAEEHLRHRGMLTPEEYNFYDSINRAQKWRVVGAEELSQLASSAEPFTLLKWSAGLIIDDMGVEPTQLKVYGKELRPMSEVISYRYERMMSTVITTNLNSVEIGARYGSRIYDRLKEVSEVLNFEGESFR
ncbi:MAG: hypothetical protein IKB03_00195 [Tidjanibacter sp.]|nr:hypothetical protein [Tidjanibacter sp.]